MEVSQGITRRSASNLALAFILLPKSKRQQMCALYAFCREVDDVADEDSTPVADRRARLQAWRDDIRLACSGGEPRFPVNQELKPVIQECHLPFALFDELLQGVEMDLGIQQYPDFSSLELYCYRVASVVGLLSIEIFGYHNPVCREYAVSLGKALQLTNILRDVANDALRGRIYLPMDELKACGVRAEEIFAGTYSDRFQALAKRVAEKARFYYHNARQLLPSEERSGMVAAELMGSVYWNLLQRLERQQFAVFNRPLIRVPKPGKLFLIFRTWWRIRWGSKLPNYGF